MSMDTIALLMRDLKDCPRHTKEEERALAGRFATADEALEAREQLILSCTPYAVALSKPYSRRGLRQEDVMQYAMLGLIDAVDRFDPSRGRLTTWVSIHVRKRILGAVADHSHVVRLPKSTFWRQAGTEALQAKADKVREGIRSLDSGSIDAEEERALQADDTTVVAEEAIWLDECREALEHAMVGMTARQRQVMHLRKAGMTLVNVGRRLGISRERVRQLQKRAIAKTQHSA